MLENLQQLAGFHTERGGPDGPPRMGLLDINEAV